MHEYTLVWEIELSADSPREAAEKARAMQLDSEARVGAFKVFRHCPTCHMRAEVFLVDLTPDEEEPVVQYE